MMKRVQHGSSNCIAIYLQLWASLPDELGACAARSPPFFLFSLLFSILILSASVRISLRSYFISPHRRT